MTGSTSSGCGGAPPPRRYWRSTSGRQRCGQPCLAAERGRPPQARAATGAPPCLHAVERVRQLVHEVEPCLRERLADRARSERHAPVEAAVGLVGDDVRVRADERAAGLQRRRDRAHRTLQARSLPGVVEDLAADDEVVGAGDRLAEDVVVAEAHVREVHAALARPGERDRRDVAGAQRLDAPGQLTREVPLRAAQLERVTRALRQQRERLLVLALLVRARVVPWVLVGGEQRLEERAAVARRGRIGAVAVAVAVGGRRRRGGHRAHVGCVPDDVRRVDDRRVGGGRADGDHGVRGGARGVEQLRRRERREQRDARAAATGRRPATTRDRPAVGGVAERMACVALPPGRERDAGRRGERLRRGPGGRRRRTGAGRLAQPLAQVGAAVARAPEQALAHRQPTQLEARLRADLAAQRAGRHDAAARRQLERDEGRAAERRDHAHGPRARQLRQQAGQLDDGPVAVGGAPLVGAHLLVQGGVVEGGVRRLRIGPQLLQQQLPPVRVDVELPVRVRREVLAEHVPRLLGRDGVGHERGWHAAVPCGQLDGRQLARAVAGRDDHALDVAPDGDVPQRLLQLDVHVLDAPEQRARAAALVDQPLQDALDAPGQLRCAADALERVEQLAQLLDQLRGERRPVLGHRAGAERDALQQRVGDRLGARSSQRSLATGSSSATASPPCPSASPAE